jgi:hypothetical protein
MFSSFPSGCRMGNGPRRESFHHLQFPPGGFLIRARLWCAPPPASKFQLRSSGAVARDRACARRLMPVLDPERSGRAHSASSRSRSAQIGIGGPHGSTPPTPPSVRVRTQRSGKLIGLVGTREVKPNAAREAFGNARVRARSALRRAFLRRPDQPIDQHTRSEKAADQLQDALVGHPLGYQPHQDVVIDSISTTIP